jgi:hypothetical protein
MTKPLPQECLRMLHKGKVDLEDLSDLAASALMSIMMNAKVKGLTEPMSYPVTAFMAGIGMANFNEDEWDEFIDACKAWAKWRRDLNQNKPN